jgi:hypothetical protein
MSNVISPDPVLTEDQSRSLPLLLDMIIPPDPDKGMPGAGELDLMTYVTEFVPDQIATIKQELDSLNQAARERYRRTFADLEADDRGALVEQLRSENARFAQNIAVQTMACYYQDDKVVVALGMEARPPFPKGNVVEPGDLSLLDPVRARKQIYRDV